MAESDEIQLTAKQKLFCEEYLVDLNGCQAAIRAGYSEASAKEIASENLTKPNIVEYLNLRRSELSDKLGLTQQWVLQRFMDISNRCVQAEPVMQKIDGEWIETGEYKFDSSGANKATEMIGKHLGMFKDSIKLDGQIGITWKEERTYEPPSE